MKRLLGSGQLFTGIFLMLVFSCSTADKGSTVIDVAAAKIILDLPAGYTQADINMLDQLIERTDSENELTTLHVLRSSIENNEGLKLFVDTSNVFNYINMRAGQKLGFTAKNAEELSKITKAKLNAQVQPLGGNVISTEIALRNGEHYPYMKLKFKTSVLDRSFYQTTYLIKGPYETYGFSVVNLTGEDLEASIKGLRIK